MDTSVKRQNRKLTGAMKVNTCTNDAMLSGVCLS